MGVLRGAGGAIANLAGGAVRAIGGAVSNCGNCGCCSCFGNIFGHCGGCRYVCGCVWLCGLGAVFPLCDCVLTPPSPPHHSTCGNCLHSIEGVCGHCCSNTFGFVGNFCGSVCNFCCACSCWGGIGNALSTCFKPLFGCCGAIWGTVFGCCGKLCSGQCLGAIQGCCGAVFGKALFCSELCYVSPLPRSRGAFALLWLQAAVARFATAAVCQALVASAVASAGRASPKYCVLCAMEYVPTYSLTHLHSPLLLHYHALFIHSLWLA
jgi:hypothetical protein